MTSHRTPGAVCLATLVATLAFAVAAPAVVDADAGASGPFAGHWVGHTRELVIHRGGRATESIGSGCCDPVVDLGLRVEQASGTRHRGTATVRVVSVDVRDPAVYSEADPAPRVGQRGRLALRDGVITESVTGTNYCDERAGRAGRCGA